MKEGMTSSNHHSSVSPVRWTAPSEGQLRLDVDASFPVASEYCGIGGVIKNHEGQLVAAFGRVLPNPGSVIMGELLAIKKGLIYVKERGFHHVNVSSDSLLAVQAVTKPVDDLSYVGTCASCIQELFLGSLRIFHLGWLVLY